MQTSDRRTPTQLSLLVMGVGVHRVGVPLQQAVRLERTVAYTRLPGAPDSVAGVIDVAGNVIPVYDTHRRLGLPVRSQSLDDLLLLADTGSRRVALTADAVDGVRQCELHALAGDAHGLPAVPHLRGVARLDDGLVIITDLEHFLTPGEAQNLDAAMAKHARQEAAP